MARIAKRWWFWLGTVCLVVAVGAWSWAVWDNATLDEALFRKIKVAASVGWPTEAAEPALKASPIFYPRRRGRTEPLPVASVTWV
jgi:hypothetical protein